MKIKYKIENILKDKKDSILLKRMEKIEEKQPILGEIMEQVVGLVQVQTEKPKRRRPKVMEEKKDCLETDEYEFVLRTQLTTSRSKMDVYFAKDKTNKLVIVKGPYRNRTEINILLRNTEWKKQNNLLYVPFEIKEMIPNRWSSPRTPLGARNKLNRTKVALFIIFDSVIEEWQLKKKVHSSKVWPETEVADWDRIPLHFSYKERKLSDQEIKDYVHALLYRYVRGIPDLADRNFLLVAGRTISIDEEMEGRRVNIYTELKKNKSEYIYKWIEENYDKLDIHTWNYTLTRPEKFRLDIIKKKETCLVQFRSYISR
jgi:hypothetical protein